jgi:hypothetical protein
MDRYSSNIILLNLETSLMRLKLMQDVLNISEADNYIQILNNIIIKQGNI